MSFHEETAFDVQTFPSLKAKYYFEKLLLAFQGSQYLKEGLYCGFWIVCITLPVERRHGTI